MSLYPVVYHLNVKIIFSCGVDYFCSLNRRFEAVNAIINITGGCEEPKC